MSYTYSISTSFSNGINLDNLKTEIESNITINKTLKGIRHNNTDIVIRFNATLDTAEQTELETVIIPNHNTSVSVVSTYNVISPQIEKIKISSNKYTVIASFIYDGSLFKGISRVKILTELGGKSGTYDIKIYDKTNHNVLQEKTGEANTDKSIIKFDNLTNVPTNDSIIEISAKGTSKTNLKIYHINVYFN